MKIFQRKKKKCLGLHSNLLPTSVQFPQDVFLRVFFAFEKCFYRFPLIRFERVSSKAIFIFFTQKNLAEGAK